MAAVGLTTADLAQMYEKIKGFRDARRFRWLRTALEDGRGVFRDILLVSLFINVLALAAPVFVLQVYDRVIFHAGLSTLQGLVIGMVVVILFDFALRQARSRFFQAVAVRIDVKVGRRLFERITSLPLRRLERYPSAHWQGLFRDLEQLRNALAGPPAALAVDLPFAILFLLLVFLLAQPVAWVLLAFLPVFAGIAWLSARSLHRTTGDQRDAARHRERLLAEFVAGRATVKSLALSGVMQQRWEDRHGAAIERSLSRGRSADGYQALAHAMTIAVTVAMTTVGALAILAQEMSMGALIAANMLGGRLVGPMAQLVGQWRALTELRQAVLRLDGVFSEEPERTEAAISLDKPDGRLRLDKVSFAYASDVPPALQDIGGAIGPGGLHAVIGRNGCGKSTFLKVLAGLYPPAGGRILLDGADLTQFTRAELAQWIGYLPQDCVLFAGSVRDNIAIADPDVDDAAVVEAAKTALLHEPALDLRDGYATVIGEEGAQLSRGLQQRVALARTFLGAPPVLLLDEPTSNLDNDAERQLAENLRDYARSATVVVVTHSPAVLAVCDTILLLDAGRVAVAGPARDVLMKLQPKLPAKPDQQPGEKRA
jgi:PrtD family type I secretion system ABC transporter